MTYQGDSGQICGPKCVLLISGKRKSGKDFVAEYLKNSLTFVNSKIVRISEPIKKSFANTNNLNLTELMSDGPYKEKYRLDMINWSEEKRAQEPGYFCAIACKEAPVRSIWIVSDIRRKTDVEWFKQTYGELVKCVRINADETARKNRGWVFKTGVDDVASECDLDDFKAWDLELMNNDNDSFLESINILLNLLTTYL